MIMYKHERRWQIQVAVKDQKTTKGMSIQLTSLYQSGTFEITVQC